MDFQISNKEEIARTKQDAVRHYTKYVVNIGSRGYVLGELSSFFVREETAPHLNDCNAEKSKLLIER